MRTEGDPPARRISATITFVEFIKLVAIRKSVRRYDPGRVVEREKLELCLEAARLAPSACNAQPWRFVVIDDPPLRDSVAAHTFGRLVSFNRFAAQAPVLVVVVAEESRVVPKLGGLLKDTRYSLMDIGIAAEHFCLQAADGGLGTCMLGWFDESGIRRVLGIPASRRVALVMTVGYPADPDAPRKRARKTIDEIRTFNAY